MISICIWKLSGELILKPVELTTRSCIDNWQFPIDLKKKTDTAPVHKKYDIKALKSYHPITLLPIWSIILKRLIFNISLIF